MSSVIGSQLEELLEPLLASTLGVGASEGPAQLAKLQDLLVGSDAGTQAAGFAWLIERVATLPPTAGCWIGVYLGGLVERGRLAASDSAPGVLRFFRTAVSDMTAGINGEEWQACAELLGPTVITQLSADAPTLAIMASDNEFMEAVVALVSTNDACYYAEGLARHHSGTLTLLDPERQRGLVVNYANLGNCFHLFTLLQSVLGTSWSQGRSQPAEMLAAAWGENPIAAGLPGDEAWFHYSQPFAEANVAASVWGEAVVDSIGMLGDQRVLVVFPAVINSRSWDANFFAPQLSLAPPSLSVERELKDAEAMALIAQLRPLPES